MFFGAVKSRRPLENLTEIEQLAAGRSIVSCDLRVAREYGRRKQGLREKARPLRENDIWIAGSARAYRLILIKRDQRFHEFEELPVEEW